MAQSTAPREKPIRPFTGWHMLAIVGSFFGVVIAVNVALAVFAAGSWSGLVVENGFVASQHYNEVLRQADAQAQRGWQSGLEYKSGALQFTLHDSTGTPVRGATVTASVARPVHEDADQSVVLRETSPGNYELAMVLDDGIWTADLRVVSHGHEPYRLDYRLWIRAGDRQ